MSLDVISLAALFMLLMSKRAHTHTHRVMLRTMATSMFETHAEYDYMLKRFVACVRACVRVSDSVRVFDWFFSRFCCAPCCRRCELTARVKLYDSIQWEWRWCVGRWIEIDVAVSASRFGQRGLNASTTRSHQSNYAADKSQCDRSVDRHHNSQRTKANTAAENMEHAGTKSK